MVRGSWLAIGAALYALAACGDATEIICEGKVVDNRCIPATAQDTTPAPTDTGGLDAAVGPTDAADGGAETVPDEWSCVAAVAGSKPMGFACGRHCECSTGYCYDEAYLGDFRFCTKPCSENCNSERSADGTQQFVCLILGGALAQKHGLTETSICQRVCDSQDDCKALGSTYDTCGTTGCSSQAQTCWGATTLAVQPTCQVAGEVQ